MIHIRTAEEIELLHQAAQVVSRTLGLMAKEVKEKEKDKKILDVDIIDTYETSVPHYKLKVKDVEYDFNDEGFEKLLFENI